MGIQIDAYGFAVKAVSQEQAIREFKQAEEKHSLITWGEYESHRTRNLDMPKANRIFIAVPRSIGVMKWSKQVSKLEFAFEAVYCGV
jgi:hypothetical protein